MPDLKSILIICLTGFAACHAPNSAVRNTDTTTIETAVHVDSAALKRDTTPLAGNAATVPEEEADIPIDTSDSLIPSLTGDTASIVLETFELPQIINGCSVIAAASEAAMQNGENLFGATIGGRNVACIRIKGVTVFLRELSDEATENTTYYVGHGYKVCLQQVILKSNWDEDESWNFKGTIEVERGNRKVKLKIRGTGGC